jgi:diguanylate cyclase (GGDEF)-like protein
MMDSGPAFPGRARPRPRRDRLTVKRMASPEPTLATPGPGGPAGPRERKAVQKPTEAKSPPATVLALSRDSSTVDILGRAFRGDRFRLQTINDPTAFEGTIRSHPPDLVIIDLDLAEAAMEAIQATRAYRLTDAIPLFVLSRPNAQGEMVAAMAAGASEIVPKPAVPVALSHRARHALRENHLMNRWRKDQSRRRDIDIAHPDLSMLVDAQGKITEIVTQGLLPSIPNPKSLVGRFVDDWLANPEDGHLSELCSVSIRGGGTRQTEIKMDGVNGIVLLDASVSAAGPGRALLVVREIESRQLGYERNPVSTPTRYDVLTGLPNRQSFAQRLNDQLPKHGRDYQMAVFRININQFAEIGNLLGAQAAEELLKGLAERLLALTERGNTRGASMLGTNVYVGRLDADALGIMTAGVRSRTDCFDVVERLRRVLEQPVIHNGRELRSTFNIGISVAPGDGLEAEALLRAASVAAASASIDDNAKLFSKTMQVQSLRRLDLETHLRRAITQRTLALHYQPKVDLKTHAVVGFEALLRWRSAELGDISPVELIPLAEQTGLIAPIGEWVLEQACTDLAFWRAQGFPSMTVAVNVSADQFHATDMGALAGRALRESGVPPEALELELTESVLMRDHRRALAVFRTLRDLGCTLSIDDFGTGYSSLQYLRRLPVQSLKIDRSFVKDLPGDKGALAICRTVIALGRSLGLEVVAEGVETVEQADTLSRRGATQAQGYLLAKPMAGVDVLPFLKKASWRDVLRDLIQSTSHTQVMASYLKDPFEE